MAYYIGLEIGEDKIKLIEMKKKWKKQSITKKIKIPLASTVLDKGIIVDKNRLYEVLKDAIQYHHLRGKKISVLLNQRSVMRWEVEAPICLEKQFGAFLEVNEKDYLPVSLKEYYITHQKLANVSGSNEQLGRFMAVGTPHTFLNCITSILERLQRVPIVVSSIVDILPYDKSHAKKATSYGILYEEDNSFIVALYEDHFCILSRVFDKKSLMTLWTIEEKIQNGWYEVLGWEIHKLIAFYNEKQAHSPIMQLISYWQQDLEEVNSYFKELLGVEVLSYRKIDKESDESNEETAYLPLINLVTRASRGA